MSLPTVGVRVRSGLADSAVVVVVPCRTGAFVEIPSSVGSMVWKQRISKVILPEAKDLSSEIVLGAVSFCLISFAEGVLTWVRHLRGQTHLSKTATACLQLQSCSLVHKRSSCSF